ncbi:MAG: phospholipid transport system transporter-binding protein [Tepidiphilus sp.]|nr:phospholipid transport system transporter-binding protein [Tepidiphilus sp.]
MSASDQALRVPLEGRIDLRSVTGFLDRWPEGVAAGSRVLVDASGVSGCDSSLVALLIDWLRRARRCGAMIEIAGLPHQALALAQLYGVDTLLPLAPEPSGT